MFRIPTRFKISIFIIAIQSLLYASGPTTNVTYAMRYDTTGYPKDFKVYLSCIDLSDNHLAWERRIDEDINAFSILENGNLAFMYTAAVGRYFSKVEEYDPQANRAWQIIETEGSGPKACIGYPGKLFVQVAHAKFTAEEIKRQHRRLSPYSYAGFEVYDRGNNHRHQATLRLGNSDIIDDVAFNYKTGRIYALTTPMDLDDPRHPRGVRRNDLGLTYLHIISTTANTLAQKVDLTDYFLIARGITQIDNLIYIKASSPLSAIKNFEDQNNKDMELALKGLPDELKGYLGKYADLDLSNKFWAYITPRLRQIEATRTTENRTQYKPNNSDTMFVFRDLPFELVATFSIGTKQPISRMISAPDDNLIILENRAPMGSFFATLLFLDIKTKTITTSIDVSGYNTMEYVGNHKLLVSTRTKLIIFNTTTLTVEKEYPGFYTAISRIFGDA